MQVADGGTKSYSGIVAANLLGRPKKVHRIVLNEGINYIALPNKLGGYVLWCATVSA